ncbi:PepSY domain-containing protein [Fulvivirga maritima]|uniref:PepSY domain-containing protein n=1 Tax=Fulvivirga maritima TaxID=2904247 RepID=UPI001F2CDFFA|nr:PepSY domain-containing protein [Fulvivirga maritima]UII26380.1 PepSY domain-containing protein [Fulvivirga maritima]
MIISVWRYSHLILAISSFVFIALASITGIILSFEPISEQASGYKIANSDDLSLGETVTTLKAAYLEVLELKVDHNGFVSASVIDNEGEMGDFYIDPFTGEKIGDLLEKSPFFEFTTSLHRSLFLKSTGRFIIGLTSFLLFLIAITGFILVLKRQQGIKKLFSRIIKENFFQYYHTYLGRLALIPIIIITITGTYLSMEKFSLLPEVSRPTYDIDYENLSEEPASEANEFPIFKNTSLSEVRSLQFPFSPGVEDYYTLQLKDKEVLVNQFTGEVLGEHVYPMVTVLSELSLLLHTGRGNVWWAIVLGLSSCSILFFIYSGFALTFKRKAAKIKNNLKKDDCKYIILIGSETGSTIPFAMQLHQQLLENGESSYITEMNRYESFPRMEKLIIITSTYGKGEAPANATKFMQKFKEQPPEQEFSYAVVGFGSLAYEDYCQYAIDVNDMLSQNEYASELMAIHTINNRSWEAYRQWARLLGNKTSLAIELPAKNPVELKPKKVRSFMVLSKTNAEDSIDDTFLIELERSSGKVKSGDLIGIYPPDEHERLYSMAIMEEGQILLSVKRHDLGVCSNYLNQLSPGDTLQGSLVKNKNFHFPSKRKPVIMIGTGTGIAPFLGMLAQNKNKVEAHLYWGARTPQSYQLYAENIQKCLDNNSLTRFLPAYSREGDRVYVQDLIEQDTELIARVLKNKGVIMICGSIAMQREVTNRLEQISMGENNKPLSYYQNKNQIRIDCY